MTSIPQVLWAQRSNASEPEKNIAYVTIDVEDVEKPTIELTATHLKFEGESDKKHYLVNLEFYDEIDVNASHKLVTGRGLFFVLRKKTAQEEFWPRLTKTKLPYVKTDFDKWVDEDEQEDEKPAEEAAPGGGDLGGGFDFSQLAGMGGAGGMPGMPDMSALGGMGGMGGMGGPGGFDMSSLAAMAGAGGMEGLGGLGGLGGEGDEGDEGEDADGEVEEAEAAEAKIQEA